MTTRRNLISGAAAIGADLVLPYARPARAAAASVHLDQDLLALRPIWLETRQAFEHALDLKSQVDERVIARAPSYPDLKTWTGDYAAFTSEVERSGASRKTIQDQEGSVSADRLEDETSDANIAVVERIEAIPARTLVGIAFKIEVSADWSHGREEMILSIMNDVLTLAQAEA